MYKIKYKKTMVTILIVVALLAGIIYVAFHHPAFGRTPRGERLERIKHSPNYRDGRFHNLHPTPQITMEKGRLHGMWDFLFGKHPNTKPDHDLPTEKVDLHALDSSKDLIVWFGHASYFIQSGGKRYLIDPVLTTGFPMSLMFRPFKGTDCYTPGDIPDIDYLIITHEHWDHLDYNTVKSLKKRIGKVICALGVGEHFEYWGFPLDKIVEMDWNETYSAADNLRIHCLPARHFSNRRPLNNQTLWASFLIEGQQRIYLSGDGGYDTHFTKIGEKFPEIDLAIMENGQYDNDWRYIHMMPDLLPRAIQDLKPKQALTVHNSKFALCKHPWFEPLENIYTVARNQPYKLLTSKIGELVNLHDTVASTSKWW